jgi:glycosyltransferase involved in cell wall biosynthesis
MYGPPVCVLTPVYNGEKFLSECIESVLSQDYPNFQYHIVNNCSTDGTLALANSYAAGDSRIKVWSNPSFVGAIANHNIAFSRVPRECKYCKVVSADDWIMPDCVRKMVHFAEAHPKVGIVGCYQRSGDTVRWRGVPSDVKVLSGREAARFGLLHGIHILGTPTSVLYRASLMESGKPFFPHSRSHADTSACYECFQQSDVGFIHEVLAVERLHSGQWSVEMDQISAGCVAYLEILLQYGSFYLTSEEFKSRKEVVFDEYYRGLGGKLLKLSGPAFWRFHSTRLAELGCSLDWIRVIKDALIEAADEAKNPWIALCKVGAVVRNKLVRSPHPF